MSELTFGEKLLIARKQLDLYQYEMAERLGVRQPSLYKHVANKDELLDGMVDLALRTLETIKLDKVLAPVADE